MGLTRKRLERLQRSLADDNARSLLRLSMFFQSLETVTKEKTEHEVVAEAANSASSDTLGKFQNRKLTAVANPIFGSSGVRVDIKPAQTLQIKPPHRKKTKSKIPTFKPLPINKNPAYRYNSQSTPTTSPPTKQ